MELFCLFPESVSVCLSVHLCLKSFSVSFSLSLSLSLSVRLTRSLLSRSPLKKLSQFAIDSWGIQVSWSRDYLLPTVIGGQRLLSSNSSQSSYAGLHSTFNGLSSPINLLSFSIKVYFLIPPFNFWNYYYYYDYKFFFSFFFFETAEQNNSSFLFFFSLK